MVRPMTLSRVSLRAKLTVLLVSLSVGPLLLSGLVHEHRAVTSGKSAVRARVAQTADFAAASIQVLVEDLQRDVRLMSARFTIENIDQAGIAEHLDRNGTLLAEVQDVEELQVFNALHDGYTRVFLALRDGRVYFAEPFHNVTRAPNLRDTDWFQRLGAQGGHIHGVFPPFTHPERPELIVVAPIFTRSGNSEGYIGVVVDHQWLGNVLTDATTPMVRMLRGERGGSGGGGRGLASMLVSPGGQVAARDDGGPVGVPTPATFKWELETGTVERKDLETPIILGKAEVGRSGWFVLVSVPMHSVYRDVYLLIWTLAGAVMLTFLFVVLFADTAARALLRPVQELERGAEMIGAGALDYRIGLDDHAHDELGRLAQTFNRMGENLLRSRREIDASARNLDTANRELDAMVFAISHDLKKHLRGIEAFSTFIEEDFSRQLGPDGLELVRSINGSVVKIERLADDLIGLVAHERERSETRLFDLGDLLREAREHSLETLPGEVVLPPNAPEIRGDRVRLLLVFTNLISNGLKFNHSPRPRVEVTVEDDGLYWAVSIRDNGIGIDARYTEHIFDLFFRLNSKDEFSGSGTGLNLARRIVEEHRGALDVQSTPEVGSCFIVRLPQDPALLTSPGVLGA
jgi:signal transduction histidine kinase